MPYINDIIMYNPIIEKHVIDVKKDFKCLDYINLKMNVSKSKFTIDEVKVLGYIVSFKGIFPDPEKVKII